MIHLNPLFISALIFFLLRGIALLLYLHIKSIHFLLHLSFLGKREKEKMVRSDGNLIIFRKQYVQKVSI